MWTVDASSSNRSTAPAVTDPALLLHDVQRAYGPLHRRTPALRGVSLTVRPGELVALSGRSGAGKTTLLAVAGGLDRADSGRVVALGVELGSLPAAALDEFRRRQVGWIFQGPGLLPLLTAQENVELGLRLVGASPEAARAGALVALENVGLAERARHRAEQLSGGERQRVAIARALAKKPPLLMADEPTGQLDSEIGGEVIALLRDAARSGVSVLAATHDVALAKAADRVIEIEDGRVSDA
jgi:putative ABC transport system ATP-binding protein